MTIGSRQNSLRRSMRAPKFLDKANGFYGRLEEPDMEPVLGNGEDVREEGGGREEEGRPGGEGGAPCPPCPGGVHLPGSEEQGDPPGMFGFNQGMMEDDGEALLLSRKPSRSSGRWRRRSSRRKREEAGDEHQAPGDEVPTAGTDSRAETPAIEVMATVLWGEEGEGREEEEEERRGDAAREEKDDQVLIKDKKRGREEEEEHDEKTESKTMGEEEEEEEGERKVVKRSAANNYRKALDRAFRRGWETFISNLYSVTLTPVTSSSSSSSSSPSSQKKKHHRAALAEFR